MFIDYNLIPEDAKVLVYPSNRKFYSTEIEEIETKIKSFIENWKTEDENFSFPVFYKAFDF